MLAVLCREAICSATGGAWARPLAAACLRELHLSAAAQSADEGGGTQQPAHVFDDGGDIVGTYTPVTKRLWQQRYKWVTAEQLAAAPPRDPATQRALVKPPKPCVVTYPFGSDPILREHYRQAGEVAESLDSLAWARGPLRSEGRARPSLLALSAGTLGALCA